MSDYERTDYTDLALFRQTDPATSKNAAETVGPTLTGKRQQMMRCIIEMCASGSCPTANEAAARCRLLHGGIQESYRKRAGELIKMGLVMEDHTRKCRCTNVEARTLRPSK